MVETLILTVILSACCGVIGGLLTKSFSPKQIKGKQLTITYLPGKDNDWISVQDKYGNEVLSYSSKNTKNGINYLKYAKY